MAGSPMSVLETAFKRKDDLFLANAAHMQGLINDLRQVTAAITEGGGVGSHGHFWHYQLGEKMHLVGLSTGMQTCRAIHRTH